MLSSKLPLIVWFFLVLTIYPLSIVLFRNYNEHRQLKWFRRLKLLQWLMGATFLVSGILFLIDSRILSSDERLELFTDYFLIPSILFVTISAFLFFHSDVRRIARIIEFRNEPLSVRIAAKQPLSPLYRLSDLIVSLIMPSIALCLFVYTSTPIFMFSLAPNVFEEQCAMISQWRPVKGGIAILTTQYVFNEKEFVVGRNHVPKDLAAGQQICVKSKKSTLGYRQVIDFRFP